MKRIGAILLVAAAGLLAACTGPGTSPSTPGDTFPVTSPAVSMEPTSAEPSIDASMEPPASLEPSASAIP